MGDEIEDIMSSMKHLLLRVDPSVTLKLEDTSFSGSSFDDAIGSYLERFDQCEIGLTLRKQIQDKMRVLIKNHVRSAMDSVENLSWDNLDSLESRIAENIQETLAFQSLQSTVKNSVSTCSECLSDCGFPLDPRNFSVPEGIGRSRRHSYSSLSSFTGSDFSGKTRSLNLSPQDCDTIVNQLSSPNSTNKEEILDKLLAYYSSDIITVDFWNNIQESLQSLILEDDESLGTKSLRLHIKLLSFSSNKMVRESYISLLEVLVKWVHSRFPNNPIDPSNPTHKKMLNIFRIINEFQKVLCRGWIRWNKNLIQDIVSKTFQCLLYGTKSSGPRNLIFLHFLALLDPTASWFDYWCSGKYGRDIILNILMEFYPSLKLVCNTFPSHQLPNSDEILVIPKIGQVLSTYSFEQMLHIGWCHSISIMATLLKTSNGIKNILDTFKGDQNDFVAAVFAPMINLMWNFCCCKRYPCLKLCPSRVSCHYLKCCLKSQFVQSTVPLFQEMVITLIVPLDRILGEKFTDESLFNNLIPILYTVEVLLSLRSDGVKAAVTFNVGDYTQFKSVGVLLTSLGKEILSRNGSTSNGNKLWLQVQVKFTTLLMQIMQIRELSDGDSVDNEMLSTMQGVWQNARELEELTPVCSPRHSKSNLKTVASFSSVQDASSSLIDSLNEGLCILISSNSTILASLKNAEFLTEIASYAACIYKLGSSESSVNLQHVLSCVAATPGGYAALSQTGYYAWCIQQLWSLVQQESYEPKIIVYFVNSLPVFFDIRDLLSDTTEDALLRFLQEGLHSPNELHQFLALKIFRYLTNCINTFILFDNILNLRDILKEDSEDMVQSEISTEKQILREKLNTISNKLEDHTVVGLVTETNGEIPEKLEVPSKLEEILEVNDYSKLFGFILSHIQKSELASGEAAPYSLTQETPPDSKQHFALSSSLVIKYGMELGLLLPDSDDSENSEIEMKLNSLVETWVSKINNNSESRDFSWPIAIAFLCLRGNSEQTWDFANRWMSVANVRNVLLDPNHTYLSQLIDKLWTKLRDAEPKFLAILQMIGLSLYHAVVPWLSNCFLGLIPWTRIIQFLTVATLLDEDAIVDFLTVVCKLVTQKLIPELHCEDLALRIREITLLDWTMDDVKMKSSDSSF